MKARLDGKQGKGAQYYRGKETVSTYTAAVCRKGQIDTPVKVECYMGRSSNASVVYCNVWIHTNTGTISGTGNAGGYGYHKESAAMQEALSNAGVTLWGSPYSGRDGDYKQQAHIDGVGDSAMREAMVAVVRAIGYRGKVQII